MFARLRIALFWLRAGAPLVYLGLVACPGFATRPKERRLSEAAIDAGLVRYEIDTQNIGGISDLAEVDEGGQRTFWLLPEQRRGVLALRADERSVPVKADANNAEATPIWPTHTVIQSIEGIPRRLDTEAFAILSPNRWLLGTESWLGERSHDAILLVEPAGLSARVVGQIDVPWDLWHLRARANEGIEGLCAVAGTIVVSGETTGLLSDGSRFAPIGLRGPGDAGWTPHALRLTSRTGKISALACRLAGPLEPNARSPIGDGAAALLEVVAIERHYQVGRLLRFFLPIGGKVGRTIEPSDLFDLTNWVDPLPNFESIAWLNEETLLLVSDNALGVTHGPTEALVVPMQNLAPILPRAF